MLLQDPTECTKKIFSEECSTLFVLLKSSNIIGKSKITDIEKLLSMIDFVYLTQNFLVHG